MGAQVQPTNEEATQEQQTQQSASEDSQENQSTQTQTATTPPTGATSEPSAPPKKDAYTLLLEDTLREQNRKIQDLQNQHVAPTEPQLTPEQQRAKYFEDPIGTMRKELADTVAPLMSFVKEFRGQGQFQQILSRFKADPRFAPHWDVAMDDTVKNIMANAEVNDANVQAAIVHAIGLRSIGAVPAAQAPVPTPTAPAPTPTPTPTAPVVTPPNIRPSAAPQPNQRPQDKLRPLTENEERLRRENKMTHKEFLEWMDVPASNVATSQIGKEPPK